MKTYIVQLESHDDVISARDKISWSKARRVLLVWPRTGQVLNRRVDLLLLLRHSQQQGAQIALVTRSSEVKAFASDLGIPVFESSLKAQSASWRRPRKQKPAESLRPAGRQLTPDDRAHLREQQESFHTRPVENRWLRLTMFSVGVLAFLVLALFFAPGARVVLKPQREIQPLSIPVWASPEIRTPNPSGGMPAHVLNVVVEGSDQAESTGQARLADKAAEGRVKLSNLTDQAVIVPQGSIVLSLTTPPVRFEVTQETRVQAGVGQTALAPVRAIAAGQTGNLAAGSIRAMEGPVGLRLTVENLDPIRGGSDRVNLAPSRADYQALSEKLLVNLSTQALDEMRTRLKPGQRLLDGTLKQVALVEEHREPPENQPADRLQLSLRVEYEAWYVEEDDLRAVSQAALDATLQSGFQPAPDSLRFEFVEPADSAVDSETNGVKNFRWELRIERELVASWSAEQVTRAIRGQTVQDAARILQTNLALDEPPQVDLYPSWWARLPFLPFRIELVTL